MPFNEIICICIICISLPPIMIALSSVIWDIATKLIPQLVKEHIEYKKHKKNDKSSKE